MIKVLLLMRMSNHGRRVQLVLLLHGHNVAGVTIAEVMILAMLLHLALLHHGPRLHVHLKTTVAEIHTMVVIKVATMLLLHHHLDHQLHGNNLLLLVTVAILHLVTAVVMLNQAWVHLPDLLLHPD